MKKHTKPNPGEDLDNLGKVASGIGFAVLAVVAAQVLLLLAFFLWDNLAPSEIQDPYDNFTALAIWLCIGWTQLFYLPPMALYFHSKNKRETRNGVLMSSAALFFLTSLCYGTMAL